MNGRKRLVIYFFYDKDGIADRYVDYFLNGLKEVTDKFVIVSNGEITPESRKIFSKYSEDIIVRENKGLDVWAYKTALEYVGWDELRTYYEVCLVNSTIMGPVYPFSEMFNKMDENLELDFWGVNRYLKVDVNPFNNPYGYLPEHVQSHFVVYRNKFLKTNDLKYYWENVPEIESYEDSVGKHESYFTKYFADKGYSWTTYVNNEEEVEYNQYLLMFNPKLAIEKYKCPIFKRRSFFHNYSAFIEYQMGEPTRELFDYIKNNTSYDTGMILENILRTCNQYDILRNLSLFYILPSNISLNSKSNEKSKIALIIHFYYEDCLQEIFEYASSMPEYADIYINTPHKELVNIIYSRFSSLPNNVLVKHIENRGRDVSSLLVGAADVVKNYDYVCFLHDKKVNQLKPGAVGKSFAYKISEAALHNKVYVENIISLFENNQYCGLLTNIPPHNGQYNDTIGNEWGPNFENTVELSQKLGLSVSIDKDKPPIAPLGTVFWFRVSAMKKIFDKKWRYSDFPCEPNAIDGTLLHAFERIYPFVVQDAGYYPAYVLPDKIASIEINNFIYYFREYNKLLYSHGIYGFFWSKIINLNILISKNPLELLDNQDTVLKKIKLILRIVLPQKLFLRILDFKRYILGPR